MDETLSVALTQIINADELRVTVRRFDERVDCPAFSKIGAGFVRDGRLHHTAYVYAGPNGIPVVLTVETFSLVEIEWESGRIVLSDLLQELDALAEEGDTNAIRELIGGVTSGRWAEVDKRVAPVEGLEEAAPELEEVEPRYPQAAILEPDPAGPDGNAYAILAAVRKALREAGVGSEEWDRFRDEATDGDYAHLLATAHRWVTVIPRTGGGDHG